MFACLTVQITVLQHSTGALKQVLQHKTQLCVLALAEFKNSWPFAGWMYQLFQNLLRRLRASDDESDHQKLEETQDENLMADLKSAGFNSNESLPSLETDDQMFLERSASGSSGGFPTTPLRDTQASMDLFSLNDSLQPFVPLDTGNWLEQPMDFLAAMAPESWSWANAPIPMSEVDAMVA